MSVDDVPEAEPAAGEVVVRPAAAGICGSEVEGYLGMMPNRVPPLVMGHEFAGEVVAAGDGVDGSWIGRRVAVNPIVGCGRCRYCLAGRRNVCPDRALIGVASPGGFASEVVVQERCLFEMPAGMDARLGALAEPLANGIHAVRTGFPEGVERAAVIGAGTIGLACLQAALLDGVEVVTVIERHPARREHALALGAHRAVDSAAEVDGGLDVVVDAAGTEATRRLALDLLGPAGTAIFVGMHADETPLPWRRVVRGNHTIRGVFAYEDRDFQRALDLLASGRAGLGELKAVLPLEEGPGAFAELGKGPTADLKVFLGA